MCELCCELCVTLQDVYPLNEFSRTGLGLDFLGIPTKRKDFQPDLGSRSVLLRGPTRFMGEKSQYAL